MKLRIALLFCAVAARAFGAACCAGGGILPSLMMGEERHLLALTTTQSWLSGEVDGGGQIFDYGGARSEWRQTALLDGATLLSDRWQVGAQIPFSRRDRIESDEHWTAAGIGDISARTAYEILPEFSYSNWRPKGFLIAQIGFPTGVSPFDVSADNPAGVRGRGFLSPSLGVALTKTWARWDALWMAEAHWPFGRTNTVSDVEFRLTPSPGASSLVAVGYSLGDLRIGTMISLTYDGPVRSEASTGFVSEGIPQWLGTPGASVHYLISEGMTVGVLYFDSSILALANSQPLEHRVAAVLQLRELR